VPDVGSASSGNPPKLGKAAAVPSSACRSAKPARITASASGHERWPGLARRSRSRRASPTAEAFGCGCPGGPPAATPCARLAEGTRPALAVTRVAAGDDPRLVLGRKTPPLRLVDEQGKVTAHSFLAGVAHRHRWHGPLCPPDPDPSSTDGRYSRCLGPCRQKGVGAAHGRDGESLGADAAGAATPRQPGALSGDLAVGRRRLPVAGRRHVSRHRPP